MEQCGQTLFPLTASEDHSALAFILVLLSSVPPATGGECNCREVRGIYSRQSVIFISISHTHKKAPTTSKQHLKDNDHKHTKAQLMLTNAQHFGSESQMY